MSRSRKNTPIVGNTLAESDKKFKTQEHKKERRNTKHKLNIEWYDEDLLFSSKKEYGSDWNSDKDGKHWMTGPNKERYMRK